MKANTVQAILDWLNEVAPFELQEDFDNAGLQLGDPAQVVHKVLVALDLTDAVIEEASRLDAQLIITHHPLLFVPPRDLNYAKHTPSLIRSLIKRNLALIATHTNIDQSDAYSASVALAGKLGLHHIRKTGGYLFLGEFAMPRRSEELRKELAALLDAPVRQYGDDGLAIQTLAIAGGAYSEGYADAKQAGAQALLTGEVRHHHAVEAVASGMVLYDGGHFATEALMLEPLALGLQNALSTVQYPLQVYWSRSKPYRLQ